MEKSMDGSYRQLLRDCEIEINNIQQWISQNRMHSNIRYLTSYSVIKSCGTIEYVLKQMLFDYLSNGANEEAKNFLTKSIIDASYNPSPGQIYKILDKINPIWKEEFDLEIKGSNEKGQLKSLVDLRNGFAHGSAITASINDVKIYFAAGVWILEKLWTILQSSS